jgi:GNAT superfamily N-acetyltransferase
MSGVTFHKYTDLAVVPEWAGKLDAGLDAVFFAASNTQTFADAAERARFRERWLGRYLTHDSQWAYVAASGGERVAGYLVASLDDPALAPRFSDLAYFARLAHLTKRFPAHLHINLAPSFRGAGTGSRLINQFITDARGAGAPGAHVVTSRGARNAGFYLRNGFREEGSDGEGAKEVIFLARAL